MMKDKYTNPISQVTVAALFFILTVVALYIFVTLAEPPERKPGNKYASGYSEKPLLDVLTEANLQTTIAQIKTASTDTKTGNVTRLSGTVGCYRTQGLIDDAFRQAGLQTDKQNFSVVVPVTEYCEILDASSRPLPDVKLYPFEPAGLLPTALPAQGVAGQLVPMASTQPLDLVKKPVEGNIALVNGIPKGVAIDSFWWQSLAAMGAHALLVKEDPTASNAVDAPAVWPSLAPPYDVKFPRFLVQGPIEKYANAKLNIRCKVTWQTKPSQNIIGVLPGKAPQPGAPREALIITSYYDSNSVVPDLAPGAEQAMSLAAMLNLVKALAPYKGQLSRDLVFVAIGAHCQAHEGLTHLLQAIEHFTAKGHGEVALQAELDDNAQKLKYLDDAEKILDAPEPWRPIDNSSYRALWMTQNAGFRQWFEHCFSITAGEIDFQRKEEYLATRLTWIRAGGPTFRDGFDPGKATADERVKPENRHPLMTAYLAEKTRETLAGSQVSSPFWMVAGQLHGGEFQQWGYLARMRAFFATLRTYHTDQVQELQDSLRIRRLFNAYDKTLTLNLALNSGGAAGVKDLAVLVGSDNLGTVLEPQSTDLRNALLANVPLIGTDPAFKVDRWGTNDRGGSQADVPNVFPGGSLLESYP